MFYRVGLVESQAENGFQEGVWLNFSPLVVFRKQTQVTGLGCDVALKQAGRHGLVQHTWQYFGPLNAFYKSDQRSDSKLRVPTLIRQHEEHTAHSRMLVSTGPVRGIML